MLGMFSVNSYAERFKYPIGNSDVRLDIDHTKSVVTDFRVDGQRFSGRIIEPSIIEHVPTGARSLEKIPVKVTASVSRAGVLAGVGALVRQGAKLGKRAVPYVGTALLAYDIYETFKDEIKEQGYQYDPETDKFVKGYEYSNCIWEHAENGIKTYGCYGVDSSIMRLMSDYSRFPEVKELMEHQMEIVGRNYWEMVRKNRNDSFRNYNFSRCYFNWNGGNCNIGEDINDARSFINFSLIRNPKYKEEMDAKKLEEILALKVDANPDKYIQATGYPGYSEKVEVAPGTKVNMGPVTDRNGNPVQVVATFGRDSQGNTTVDVQVIPRPDLTPGSAEAPETKPKPAPTPETNPKEKENPREEDQDNPKPTPTPGETPSPNESPKDRREEKKPDGNGGLLCDLFPKILACAEMGEPSENDFEGIAIPKAVNEETWSPDNMFPSSGVCPKDKTFHVFGKAFSVSYQPLCTLMENVRFAVIIGFIIMSAFITFGSLRKE
ncbi:IgG-binding virulence factor TspB family protein [Neisseria meningitidis]|nr:IgG-binding virulence factor TspB family protein [Neisseria meningitidis]ARC05344.1 T cell/B cell stimulating protein TspB [Neisseria meningitidis]MBW3873580.1 T cell/B cell stimulating protein TspB [Neisseria meningitidis]MBW3890840.1 T cell/B cell stimulating protein TspB [Neisseria meningitidis]MBW3896841.1 T cell/B cell stimulating protein TspB [Neisseria meningitidis]MBW3943335.1 T cell/B cell stimulating protein TspB [Neisseria meningitidis]